MITALYAALLGLLFIGLSIRTIRLRRRHRVAIGYGDSQELIRAGRAHANFAEYVPLSLVLIYFVEINSDTAWLIHLMGITLLVSRVIHAYGVSQVNENYHYRIMGMTGTFTVIAAACLYILLYRLI